MGRLRVFEMGLQRSAQQTGQHAESLGPVEGVVGVAVRQDRLSSGREEVAELPPRGAVDDLLCDLVHQVPPKIAPMSLPLVGVRGACFTPGVTSDPVRGATG